MKGRIVIVGAGIAGTTAARTLRAEGYTGDIVLLGAEPHLPYRRPVVSKEILAGTADESRTLLQPTTFWRDHNIDLRTGTTVESIDPAPALVWLADGTAIGYDSLLLATGARPRALTLATDPAVAETDPTVARADIPTGRRGVASEEPGAADLSDRSRTPLAAGFGAVGRVYPGSDPMAVRGNLGRRGAGIAAEGTAATQRVESATIRGGYGSVGVAERILTLRGRADAEVLREAIGRGGSLLIVGAGLIGCEVAATARGLGVEVTVVDAAGLPLERVAPPVVGEFVRKLHADNGVAIHTDVLLTHLGYGGVRVVAAAADGRAWNTAAVLVAIGSVPDTFLAEAAGLAVADGIRVDEHYRTSAAGVYAAGDVASRFDPEAGEYRRDEHWNSAQSQGAAAARSMLGKPRAVADIPWGWSMQYGRNIQFAGRIRADDEQIVRGSVESGDATVIGLCEGRMTGVVALGRAAEFRAARDLMARGAVLDSGACADESRPLAAVLTLSGQS
ncbi:FAD-dependent oxidoreductase [Nocardia sp. CDC153]|uniref:NAD(P)/FAD-dependent oxidoreductase n=1 Tax=Nocardia sp. CDC153 TaxID=3112167 RepID=UPI002DC020C2|nr:FAD-dependent oxidoreductase [Nocardia sp. CDC153]MEC3957853.1 FAD-dependent oxidoreductase [Nocardia sp. CDC153]